MSDAVEALGGDVRETLAASWLGRAEGARSTAETFRVVAAGLRALAAEPELVTLAARAVDDELRHADLCWRMACRYAGRVMPEPPPRPLDLPRYDGADEALRHTLHVVGQCCLNETTASAFLERCLKLATDEPVRAPLRALLADEVDHARLGWAHLASPRLSAQTRAAVAGWLPRMVATNRRMWHKPELPVAPVYAAHGLPSTAEVDAAVEAALADLIVPGLRHVGIAVG